VTIEGEIEAHVADQQGMLYEQTFDARCRESPHDEREQPNVALHQPLENEEAAD
jgi:hypothetical protein